MESVIGFGSGVGLACGLFFLPPAAYMFLYLVLRLSGKLAAAAGGWHAGGWHFRGRVAVSAHLLFVLFQPLLRREAALRRIAPARREEPAISEVVVEVITLA